MSTQSNLHLTMESLDLPKDLYWGGKIEPTSPPSATVSELFACSEATAESWLDDDFFANGITIINKDDIKQTTSLELLKENDFVVEFVDFKYDECLLDQKLPHYIDYEPNHYQTIADIAAQPVIPILPITKAQAAAVDFEAVYEAATVVFEQLTPPQSPPQCSSGSYLHQTVKDEQKALLSYATDANTIIGGASYYFNRNEIERETQLVDEIVKARAQELQLSNWQQYNDDCESQSSSSAASLSSSSLSSITDEEWLPNNVSLPLDYAGSIIEEQQTSAPASPIASSISSSSSSSSSTCKKRTRAYGRGVEDRKIRKKEQNKNAATRYRQKKKLEMEHVLSEEQQLVQENESLRRTLNDRRHESRYLRQLIREFYQGRKSK